MDVGLSSLDALDNGGVVSLNSMDHHLAIGTLGEGEIGEEVERGIGVLSILDVQGRKHVDRDDMVLDELWRNVI